MIRRRLIPVIIILLSSYYFCGCAGNRAVSTSDVVSYLPVPETPSGLSIVYPHINSCDTVISGPQYDSVFVFGSVPDVNGHLYANGNPVEIHPLGSWLAWTGFDSTLETNANSPHGEGFLQPVFIEYYYPGSSIPGPPDETRTVWFFHRDGSWSNAPPRIYPFSGRLTVTYEVSSAKIRCGWPGTYDLFPPEGTVLWGDGVVNTGRRFYRVPLGLNQVGYIEDEHVVIDESEDPPERSVIYSVRCEVDGRETRIHVPLRERSPFRVQRVNDNQLSLTIYNAMSWTDIIVQPHGSPVVDEIRWAQLDSITYNLTAYINRENFWGWDVEFDDEDDLTWTIYEAPVLQRHPLRGLTVVLDPGHGDSNTGAVGPTRLTEKEANLELAFVVRDELERAGAQIFLTRESDVALSLDERVEIAREYNADIIISLHYNGLPQGVTPAEHHGTSVHYNHRHSKRMAEELYVAICAEIGWDGDGLRYQDLTLARPTFCPSVLIENGFLMHPEEEAMARSPEFRRKVAQGIREGLESYLLSVREAQGGH